MCGGLLTSVSGNITFHPPMNNSLSNLIQCSWLIQPPIRANMTTVIDLSNLEMNHYCYWKMLHIYEGKNIGYFIIFIYFILYIFFFHSLKRKCQKLFLKKKMSSDTQLLLSSGKGDLRAEKKHFHSTSSCSFQWTFQYLGNLHLLSKLLTDS